MGLQVWLPLNGNTNNLGLSGNVTTSGNIAYADSGKIGKCFQSGSQYISLLPENIPTSISICFWVKPNSPGAWSDIFSLGVNDNRMEVSTTTQYYWYCNSYSTQLIDHGTALFVLDNSIWNHVCMTADGNTVKFYLNGILIKSVSQSNSLAIAFGSSLKINIGARIDGSMLYSGYINDFRIYDHCLSVKEVKEIAKGLVCHYPLKSQYDTGQVNKYGGDIAEGSLGASGFTKTKLENERGYNYKLSYTGTDNNIWYAIYADNFSFTPGKKYYYSCKVRCHSRNFNLYLRASRSNNDWVTNSTSVLNPDGKWHEYVVYQTINETYVRADSNVTSNPILEFYTDNLYTSGKVYSADFDIKDVQVVESDCYVPFIDNSMSSNIIGDCSGYGNDGTKSGTIKWNGNTPRYSGSYKFNTDSYIKAPTMFLPEDFSVSIYGKWDSFNNWSRLIDFGSLTSGKGYGFLISNSLTTSTLNFSYEDGSGGSTNVTIGTISLDTWYHIAVIFQGTIIKIYINGELVKTFTISSPIGGHEMVYNYLAKSNWDADSLFNGQLSDFRIYATALSADDVKSLYNTSASLSKNGTLLAYEFNEEE